MALEDDLQALLMARCERSFPLTAPHDTQLPYLIWQHVGGDSLRFLDNTAPATRNAAIQVTAWAATPRSAFLLIRQVEDALCASPALQAAPQGEPVDAPDDADEIFGATQTFSVWGART